MTTIEAKVITNGAGDRVLEITHEATKQKVLVDFDPCACATVQALAWLQNNQHGVTRFDQHDNGCTATVHDFTKLINPR